ncbi:MAG: glycosyltransferase family 9 protein [Candidatus Omnitrophota bacterium]|nr:glycosyltransferase family 9 protein [Candidatus Omnitrophota bacterium]
MTKVNCKYYKGDSPCYPHKKYKTHCLKCEYYKKISTRILIIKLAAVGDVIRTTPLLRRIKEEFPACEISWLTQYPDVLPEDYVDNNLNVNIANTVWLENNIFDWVINLDKDKLAISLATKIKARKKSGFSMDRMGKCSYFSNKAAKEKWLTGLWDDLSKKNRKNYLEEIFEICGYKFKGEHYILNDKLKEQGLWNINRDKKTIGLNTGCGDRWKSRLWSEDYWVNLAGKLANEGFEVVLLGGEAENGRNEEISSKTGAKYFGHFALKKFINLVNQCDLVVTAVTMAMHIAIGLDKKVIVLNSCFNKNEFYLYEKGLVLQPTIDCNCYYSPTCDNNCMRYLYVDAVYDNILDLINKK